MLESMAELTDRRKAFIEHYLTCWNRTEAARLAGYAQPAMEGSRLMKNDEISRAIKNRLEELKVSADEVITRLSDHARSSMADYVDPTELPPVLKKAAESGKLSVVKKIVTTKRYFKGEVIEEKTEFELYDAQAALVHLGKHHKLFTEKMEHTGEEGGPVKIKVVYESKRRNVE
jgi:phage terminase small subunit